MKRQNQTGYWRERHDPYSDWLLAEDPLTPEQRQALQAHLESCPDCRRIESSLAEVGQLFKAVPQAAPETGFAARWQQRQAEEQRDRHQRQTWIILLITFAFSGLSFLIMEAQAVQMLNSPSALTLYLISRLTNVYLLLETTEGFATTIFRILPGLLPIPILAMLLGLLSLLSVLWFVSISHTTRRGEQHE